MSLRKSFKKKLTGLFAAVAIGSTAVFGADADPAHARQMKKAPVAPLTEGETALVQSIFGESVNTTNVVKHFIKTADPKYAAHVHNEKDACFLGPSYKSEDYSKDDRPAVYGVFVHEMTHIWQFQNVGREKMNWCTNYVYTLTATSAFNDYCIEQQAAMVEDYARRFLDPGRSTRWISISEENDALLKKVVEEQFPKARETRLKLEEKAKPAAQEKEPLLPAVPAPPKGCQSPSALPST